MILFAAKTLTAMEYPIYLKGAVTFHKINSANQAVTVVIMDSVIRVRLADHPEIVKDILRDSNMTPSSRDEFEKAYGKALWRLTQANNKQ